MRRRRLYVIKLGVYSGILLFLTSCSSVNLLYPSRKDENLIKDNIKQAIAIIQSFRYKEEKIKEYRDDKIVIIVKKQLLGEKNIWIEKFNKLKALRDTLKSLPYLLLPERWRDDLDFLICLLDLNLKESYRYIYNDKKENQFQKDFVNSTQHLINTEYVDGEIEPSIKQILKNTFWDQFEELSALSLGSSNDLNEIQRIKAEFQLIMGTDFISIGNIEKGRKVLENLIEKHPNTNLANSAKIVIEYPLVNKDGVN